MKDLGVILVLVCLFVSPGCVIIPTGEYYAGGGRNKIAEETVKFLQDGATTKEDVLLHLGEPDEVWSDEREFLYWTAMEAGMVFMIGGGAGSLRSYLHLLFIEFDEQDIVRRHQLKTRTVGHPIGKRSVQDFISEEMDLWVRSPNPGLYHE